MKTNNTDPDNDFYILQGTKKKKPFYKKFWFWIALIATFCAIMAACVIIFSHSSLQFQATYVEEPESRHCDALPMSEKCDYAEAIHHEQLIATQSDVNGFHLLVFTLSARRVSLQLGPVDTEDPSILLAVHAANTQASDGKIAGTFVEKGKLLSQGDSPQGYCAIIDGKITIGAAKSAPVLEEVLIHDGYFFRQLPLVVDGMVIDNNSQGKSPRWALCEKEGQVLVIKIDGISLHDFSQTLVEYGVSNAICLGGDEGHGHDIDKSDPMLTYLIYR